MDGIAKTLELSDLLAPRAASGHIFSPPLSTRR
jgi:hypothetical protein